MLQMWGQHLAAGPWWVTHGPHEPSGNLIPDCRCGMNKKMAMMKKNPQKHYHTIGSIVRAEFGNVIQHNKWNHWASIYMYELMRKIHNRSYMFWKLISTSAIINGFSSACCQAFTWTNISVFSIRPSEQTSVKFEKNIYWFSFKKMHL